MNAQIRTFEISLRKYIEETEIPEEVKHLVLKQICNEVKAKADALVVAELNQKEVSEDAESV